MKKLLILLITLSLLALSSCGVEKVSFLEYNTFFSDGILAECHLEGMPMPNIENSVLYNDDGKTLYLNISEEEFTSYTRELADYLLAREDIHNKGLRYTTDIAVGPLFLPLSVDVYIPLEDQDEFSLTQNKLAFSTEKELTSGWISDLMSGAYEIELCFKGGVIETIGFSYTASVSIDKADRAQYETCLKEHKYTTSTPYPVPNTDTVVNISSCVYCNYETKDTDYCPGDRNAYKKVVTEGAQHLERECAKEYQSGATSRTGQKELITLPKREGYEYTVKVNDCEIPLTYENDGLLVYGFIMPRCDIEIRISLEKAIDEGLVFEMSEYGGYIVTDYTGNAKRVIIPDTYKGEPVTEIGGYAFADCTTIESVVIGNLVTEIDMGAFTRCYNLKEITLSGSLILIDVAAFKDCTALKSVVLPSSIRAIAPQAFRGCTSLESVEFPYADKNCWLSNPMFTTTGNSVGGTQYNASNPQKNASYLISTTNAIYYRNR